MAEQFGDFIIMEVKKIYTVFEKEGIDLSEIKALQYSVKYEVKYNGIVKGIINLYYSPKKDKFTFQEDTGKDNIDSCLVADMQRIIDNRHNINNERSEDIKKDIDIKIVVDDKISVERKDAARNKEAKNRAILISRLKDHYDKLKPYRSYNFDFSQFAQELQKCFYDEYTRKCIQDNIYEFSVLEEYYLKVINSK